ncbi:MAG: entericidin, EcnA/B family [Pseudomonadota bacterium]
MKKLMVIALVATTALGACGTIEGIGKDISSAARGVKNAF